MKSRAAKTSADIAKRAPTNSLGEPWVEGQTWTCLGCGAAGPDRDDVRMPASCECVATVRYSPAEHEAALVERRVARAPVCCPRCEGIDDAGSHCALCDGCGVLTQAEYAAHVEAQAVADAPLVAAIAADVDRLGVTDDLPPPPASTDDPPRWNTRWLRYCEAQDVDPRSKISPQAFSAWVHARWAEWGAAQTPPRRSYAGRLGEYDFFKSDQDHPAFDAWLVGRTEEIVEECERAAKDRRADINRSALSALGEIHGLEAFTAHARAAVHAYGMLGRDADRKSSPGYYVSCMNGHAVRALVGLLEWLAEPCACDACNACDPVLAYESRRLADRAPTCADDDCDGDGDGGETCVERSGIASLSADEATREADDLTADDVAESVASLLLDERGCEVWRADWRQLAVRARDLGGVDALVVDAPYSAAVHAGHGTMERHGTSTPPAYDGASRREIDYSHWTPDDVRAFVSAWSPLVRGWFCAMADDELALAWKVALRDAGRLVFPLIPCTERGATVRMAGEGPSSCTTFLIVARPRTAEAMRAAVDLDYESHHVGPREKKPVIGGKPVWLARAIVRSYTRPGDLVADPCAGGGTTGLACIVEGRRALLGDVDAAHAAIAAERLRAMPAADRKGTLALFGSGAR